MKKTTLLACVFLMPISLLWSQNKTTTFLLDRYHDLFFAYTLANDDLLVVTREGLPTPYAITPDHMEANRTKVFKIHRFSPDLEQKWVVTFSGNYPKFVPAGGGEIIYIVDSVQEVTHTIKKRPVTGPQLKMRVIDANGELLKKKTFFPCPIESTPLLYLSDGMDLLFFNHTKRIDGNGVDINLNRLSFGDFALQRNTIELPEEYLTNEWDSWRFIGQTEEELLFATRKKFSGETEEAISESFRQILFKVLTLDKKGKQIKPLQELSIQTKPQRYLKPHFVFNAFPNRDLAYLAWKVHPAPLSESYEAVSYEEESAFRSAIKYFASLEDRNSPSRIYSASSTMIWRGKNWAYGNLWLNPKDNHFYVYGLTGPSPKTAGLKAAHDGYLVAKFDREAKEEWKIEHAFPKDFQKFSYFRIHATEGKRELDIQSQLNGDLFFGAWTRTKKGAYYLSLSETGKKKKEMIALEKQKLLFKQALGFPRVYRWKKHIYFHTLNSKGEFIVYSRNSFGRPSSTNGKQKVFIERYY